MAASAASLSSTTTAHRATNGRIVCVGLYEFEFVFECERICSPLLTTYNSLRKGSFIFDSNNGAEVY